MRGIVECLLDACIYPSGRHVCRYLKRKEGGRGNTQTNFRRIMHVSSKSAKGLVGFRTRHEEVEEEQGPGEVHRLNREACSMLCDKAYCLSGEREMKSGW